MLMYFNNDDNLVPTAIGRKIVLHDYHNNNTYKASVLAPAECNRPAGPICASGGFRVAGWSRFRAASRRIGLAEARGNAQKIQFL
jgi:hypothetical protein